YRAGSASDGFSNRRLRFRLVMSCAALLLLALAWQLADALAPGRQRRFLDNQDRQTVLDCEPQRTALALQMLVREPQAGRRGDQRAAQHGEKILANHGLRSLALSRQAANLFFSSFSSSARLRRLPLLPACSSD